MFNFLTVTERKVTNLSQNVFMRFYEGKSIFNKLFAGSVLSLTLISQFSLFNYINIQAAIEDEGTEIVDLDENGNCPESFFKASYFANHNFDEQKLAGQNCVSSIVFDWGENTPQIL